MSPPPTGVASLKLTLVAGECAVKLTGIPEDITPERINDYARVLRAELFAVLDGTEADEPALPPDPSDA